MHILRFHYTDHTIAEQPPSSIRSSTDNVFSEGPGNGTDWIGIKAATGCFFIPDWSSVGAQAAMGVAGGVADGLFSWVRASIPQ